MGQSKPGAEICVRGSLAHRLRTWTIDAGGLVPCKAPDMHLVNDQVFQGRIEGAVPLPVKGVPRRGQRACMLRPCARHAQRAARPILHILCAARHPALVSPIYSAKERAAGPCTRPSAAPVHHVLAATGRSSTVCNRGACLGKEQHTCNARSERTHWAQGPKFSPAYDGCSIWVQKDCSLHMQHMPLLLLWQEH